MNRLLGACALLLVATATPARARNRLVEAAARSRWPMTR